jgi:hypothetical protein
VSAQATANDAPHVRASDQQPASQDQGTSLHRIPHALLIAGWPLLLLGINAEWIFPLPGSIDPWVYFGTFINFPEHLQFFAGTYYVTRLSWILPGYLVHAALPPLAAAVLLHLTVLYTILFATYYCLRAVASARAALLVTVCLAAYGPVLEAVGGDYVDGAGMAYFLAALAALTAAARSRQAAAWWALSGFCMMACIVTNVAWIAFGPAYLAYGLLMTRHRSQLRRAASLAAGALGAVTLFALLAIVNQRLVGTPWFLAASVSKARALVSAPNEWAAPTLSWLWSSAFLGTAAVIVALSLVRLALASYRRTLTREMFAAHFVCLWSATVLLALQISGTPVLQLAYYSDYAIPGLALAAGELTRRSFSHLSERGYARVVCLVLVVVGIAFWRTASAHDAYPAVSRFAIGLACASAIAGAAAAGRRRPQALAAALVPLAILVPVSGTTWQASAIQQRIRNYEVTVAALDVLRPLNARRPLFFWHPGNGSPAASGAYTSIASSYLWGYRLFSNAYPSPNGPFAANGTIPNRRIVLMTETEESPADVAKSLGHVLTVVDRFEVRRSGLVLHFLVFDAR